MGDVGQNLMGQMDLTGLLIVDLRTDLLIAYSKQCHYLSSLVLLNRDAYLVILWLSKIIQYLPLFTFALMQNSLTIGYFSRTSTKVTLMRH